MTRIAHSRRGLVRGLGVAAAALLIFVIAPVKEVSAMSLITPSASPSAKQASEGLTTEVHGGGHGGGGGGWHGGGGGGWHGGRWHGGGGWHGGVAHFGGFHHRHFFVGGDYYPYDYGDYYSYHPACRVVWTSWGPRRICGYHHWHGWHRHWHRWHRRHW